MQEVGTIKCAATAWISNYYLSQNNCYNSVYLSITQGRLWPIYSELMPYSVM
jgi:hypothetical protein